MSSYPSVRTELLKIDHMILQAHAGRLIKKIHHDLVDRQCKLFEKVAKLDSDSLILWRNDSGFFQDVMKEIDMLDLGQINEKTLYKNILDLKKKYDRAAAATAAAIASAAAANAAATISALSTSNASASRTLIRPSSPLSDLSPTPLVRSSNSSKTFTSGKPQQDLPVRRSTQQSTKKPPPRNATSNGSGSCTIPPPITPAPSGNSRNPIIISDSDDDQDEDVPIHPQLNANAKAVTVVSKKSGRVNHSDRQKKRSHIAVEEDSDDDDDDDDEQMIEAQAKTGKASNDKKNSFMQQKGKIQVKCEETEHTIDSEPNDDETYRPKVYRQRKGRHYVGSTQFYPQPCELCTEKNVPCEKPVDGGSCMLCKSWTRRCMHALSRKDIGKLMTQRAMRRRRNAAKNGKKL
ncbi:hypothetical protein BDN70DRAFT_924554 [Pholiota conissans]|uniref:Uncharacterized protein n=1 Tax=Pholiota conissans TaxID=109636 RepID=A0A9P6CPC9_9AGAR|nr:hypothetical protein BDN70DRAFT_924554 [Pholiota conissans]